MKTSKPDILKEGSATISPREDLKAREQGFRKEIGNLIREMRERQSKGCMSQEDLARLLGMSRSNLAHIENGNQSISIYQLWLVAFYLNCDIEMLFPQIPETRHSLTKGERRTLKNKDKNITAWVEQFKY